MTTDVPSPVLALVSEDSDIDDLLATYRKALVGEVVDKPGTRLVRPRAALYVRASLDMTGERASVRRQEEAARKLCDLRDWDVVDVYEDNSITGTGKKKRPEWERLLRAIGAGEVDIVVSWHIDRLTRNMADLERLITLADEFGVGVATAVGDIDLTTDAGRMVARILAAVARAEIERKAERQRSANQQRAYEGKPYTGGPRPFGYNQGQTEFVEAEKAVLLDGARWVLAGVSNAEIARRWTATGLFSAAPTQTGQGWTARGVAYILSHPRYAGLRTYKGVPVTKAEWPALFDSKTHLALREKLNDKSKVYRHDRGAPGNAFTNLLSQIAVCGVCDQPVSASAYGPSGRRVLSYACKQGHGHVRRELAEQYVTFTLAERLALPDALRGLTVSDVVDVSDIEAEISDLTRRITDFTEALADGDITRAEMSAGVRKLRPRLEAAERRLAQAGTNPAMRSLANARNKAATFETMEIPQQRDILSVMIEKVALHPAGKGTRTWNPREKVIIKWAQ
jgi:site-specific DNA recombinase